MKSKYLLLLGLVLVAATPQMSSAATRVSRQFASYFPQKNGAIIFSDESFYQSIDPTQAYSWSSIDINKKNVDSFDVVQAVRFKHHVYTIGGPTPENELVPTHSKILRMASESPSELEVVKAQPPSNEEHINLFRDLVRYQRALFASDSNGNLFRSINGVNWRKVKTTGLPANVDLEHLITGSDTLYAIYIDTVYTSSNGKTWTELTGPYQDHTYNGSVSVAELNGKTYVASYSHEDENAFVWQVGNRGRFTQLFSKSNDVRYRLFTVNNTLYLTGSDGSVRTLQNGQFNLVDEVNGEVQDIVENNGTPLLIVNKRGNLSLWR